MGSVARLVDDGTENWRAELDASDRPDELKQAILDYVAAGERASRAVALVEVTDRGSRWNTADTALAVIGAALALYLLRMREANRTYAPAVVEEAARYALVKAGGVGVGRMPLTPDATRALIQAADDYLAKNSREVATLAGRLVSDWAHSSGDTPRPADIEALRAQLAPALDGLDYRTTRVVVTEVQNAYAGLQQQALARSKRVRRIAFPGACERCAALAGVHPPDFPDLYFTHPHCLCSWEAA